MDWMVTLRDVRRVPGMFFGSGPNYRELVTFLVGCDLSEQHPLSGFKEWLLVKEDAWPVFNCWWAPIVSELTIPGSSQRATSEEEQSILVEGLWNLVEEFLAVKSSPGSLPRILQAHADWEADHYRQTVTVLDASRLGAGTEATSEES